ncbi:MAG: hypothetical protein ABW184_13590 [Sphingobium sp.]
MRLMSAFALAVSVSAVALSGPVVAAKKEKPAEAAKPAISAAFGPSVQEMQKANNAKDWPALKAAIDKGTPSASSPDDKFFLAFYNYQYSIGVNDTALQRTSVEAMVASGKAPADLAPKLEGMLGQWAIEGGDPDKAIGHLERALTAPDANPALNYLLAESYFSKGVKAGGGQSNAASVPLFTTGLASLQKAIDGMKAAGQPIPPAYYDRGAQVARAVGGAEGQKWALASVEQGGSPEGWNILLTGYQDSHRNMTRNEMLDLYRLMSTAKAFQQPSEYAEYADAALKSGLVGEAKAVIDQGRAVGKIQPTQLGDIYQLANAEVPKDRAGLPASEAAAAKAADGKIAASTASAYLGYGDNAKAATLYRLAIQKGGVDANEVNTRLGIALTRSGDKEGAKAAFGAVTGPRKELADLWIALLNKTA